jgi:ABC-type spermidine/putrescine transport system permease subunit I
MSTDESTLEETVSAEGLLPRMKYLVVSYPAATLGLLFVLPVLLLVVVSVFVNIEGGFFEPGFTVENYVRFFQSDLYRNRMLYTLRLAGMTALACLVVGYPLAYYIARLDSQRWRRFYLSVIISSLFLTFIIRAFAWQVLLASDSIVPQLLETIGLRQDTSALVPSYFALVVGMVYVFLPFMVLTLFTSIRDVDRSLEEASRSLGAGPLTTFKEVTLPLTKNGIISGTMLVFVLSLGVYVLPRILGNPQDWTLAVLIGDQVGVQGNVPFGAALSIVLLVVVVGILGVGRYILGKDGGEAI